MNHLFTLKARIIIFSLLICQLGLRAQSTGAKTDTTNARRPDTSFALKADTSLAVKAGSTLVIKSDTMMVIHPDATMIAKAENAIAKKADALSAANGAAQYQNTDASKKSDAVAPSGAAAIPPPSDGVIQVKNTAAAPPADGVIEVKNAAGTVQDKDYTSALSAKTDAAGVAKPDTNYTSYNKNENTTTAAANTLATTDVKKDSNAAALLPSSQKTDSDPAKTPETTPAIKPDTTLVKKGDTTLVKKSDTTLVKKADSTLVKRSDTTIVQKPDTTTDHTIKAESAFLEVGGPGLAISANYDARFKKERDGWGYRIGLGYFASGGNTVFTIPFQVNYLIGEHSHMLELGAGTTFLNSTGTNAGNSKWEFDKVTGFIATASIGYRFQPIHSGINVRIAFVPILYDEGIIPAGGISVGYTFK